jgi:hypothetical protein
MLIALLLLNHRWLHGPIPATSTVADGILTWALPLAVLIAVLVWYVVTLVHRPELAGPQPVFADPMEDAQRSEAVREVRAAYAAHPLELLCVVLGDVYLPNEVEDLCKHLRRTLPAGTLGLLDDFLELTRNPDPRGSHSMSLGRVFNQRLGKPSRSWGIAEAVDWLPDPVHAVDLTLSRETTGLTTMQAEVLPSAYGGAMIESLGSLSAEWPLGRFEQDVQAICGLRLFPANLGGADPERRHDGAMFVWQTPTTPDVTTEGWRSLELLLSNLGHYQGVGCLVFTGRTGWHWVLPEDLWSGGGVIGADANASDEASSTDNLGELARRHLLLHFLEPVWISVAVARLESQAAGFASRVEGLRPRHGLGVHSGELADLAVEMGACQYRVSRLGYMWRARDGDGTARSNAQLRRWDSGKQLALKPPPPEWLRKRDPFDLISDLSRIWADLGPDQVLQGVIANVTSTLQAAGADLGLSRAWISDLLQVRSGSAMLVWAIVAGMIGAVGIVAAVLIALLSAR